jgi:hypothetical protein
MEMACSRSHFPIFIHKDTEEDHERSITYLWNLDALPNGTISKSHQDDDGQRLFGNKSRHLLKHLLLDPSWRSTKSLFEIVT